MWPTFLQFVGTALAALWARYMFRRWMRNPLDVVPGPPSKSWFTGSILELIAPQPWEYYARISKKYGAVFRFNALLSRPALYVYDPKALYYILVKDVDVYEETEPYIAANSVILGPGLASTTGEQHRKQRKMMNPVFAAARIKQMTPTFNDVVHKLRHTLEEKVKTGTEEIDISSWMGRTALELIGQSGLGYSFDSLTESGKEHRFSIATKSYAEVFAKLRLTGLLVIPRIIHIGTPQLRRRLLDFVSLFWKNMRRARDIVDVMTNTTLEIYEAKKKALVEGDDALLQGTGNGKDIISVLMKANLEASNEDRLPEAEVLAQMTTMTFAAVDTTSNALSRIFHVLGENQDIQDKLRQEVLDAVAARDGPTFEYEELMKLPYLDAVIKETMRVYAPVPILFREVKENIVLPISKSFIGLDWRDWEEIPVPKGTLVVIGIQSANLNPELWGPDAHEWKPERWLSPLPESLVQAKVPGVYSHTMSFIGGGRSCIGFKFSELEMKVILAVLLEKMRFCSADKKIVWKMNGITQPTVHAPGYDPDKIQLPMRVELI